MKKIILKKSSPDSFTEFLMENMNQNLNLGDILPQYSEKVKEKESYARENIKSIIDENKLNEYTYEILSNLDFYSNEELNLILFAPECPVSIIYHIARKAKRVFSYEKVIEIFSNLSDKKREELIFYTVIINSRDF